MSHKWCPFSGCLPRAQVLNSKVLLVYTNVPIVNPRLITTALMLMINNQLTMINTFFVLVTIYKPLNIVK